MLANLPSWRYTQETLLINEKSNVVTNTYDYRYVSYDVSTTQREDTLGVRL